MALINNTTHISTLVWHSITTAITSEIIYYTPTTKCGGGGYTGFALSRRSVGRSVRLQFLSAL